MDWNCPECGQLNDEELIRCGCGYEIDEEEKNYDLGKYDDIGSQKSEPNLNDDTMPNVAPRLFIRRIAAFIIDTVLLGILGQVLSIGLTSQLILLGEKGRFIGLFVLSVYFGLGNSRVFNGQTVGKFLMKISLKRLDGEKLPISVSLLRSLIYVVPFIFNGWGLDLGRSTFAKSFAVLIGSWLFSYIISLIVFVIGDWRSGRLIQDIIFKTRVDLINSGTISTTKKEKVLFAISACIFTGFLALGTLIADNAKVPEKLIPIADFHQLMLKEYPDFRFGVNLNHVTGGESLNILTCRAFPRRDLNKDEIDRYSNAFAMRAISDFREIAEVDFLCIGISEGFDIGIAKRHLTYWERWPVGTWRKKLGIKGDLEQGENKKLPFLPSMPK